MYFVRQIYKLIFNKIKYLALYGCEFISKVFGEQKKHATGDDLEQLLNYLFYYNSLFPTSCLIV